MNPRVRQRLLEWIPSPLLPAARYGWLRLRWAGTVLSECAQPRAVDGLALPPPLRRYRVGGHLDRERFLRVGREARRDLERALRVAGRSLSDFGDALDFGCGFGRVLRHFARDADGIRFTGTDIDPEAIAWCTRQLPFARFAVAPHRPPLPFDDASFDFVYAISVFTHLDEELQHAWLAELARVSRPGATLLLSTHGAKQHAALPAPDRARLRERGFCYRTATTGRFKLDGLPDFYQEAYHTPA
ncbi:MAG: class I SAM-dependent methyltransferase, partial [Deltaproteobacteria bacterium]